MEVKPHQIAQVSRQTENLSKASKEAKNTLKADDICFKGSVFGKYGFLDPDRVLRMEMELESYRQRDHLYGVPSPIQLFFPDDQEFTKTIAIKA